MTRAVLDASAVLALLQKEPGAERVESAIAAGASMSTVNLAEVVSKLSEHGMPEKDIRTVLDLLQVSVEPFTVEDAVRAGLLRLATRTAGLSLGDRACLALASRLAIPVLTTDRQWKSIAGNLSNISVEVVR
jgi:ribonuclease VapC